MIMKKHTLFEPSYLSNLDFFIQLEAGATIEYERRSLGESTEDDLLRFKELALPVSIFMNILGRRIPRNRTSVINFLREKKLDIRLVEVEEV